VEPFGGFSVKSDNFGRREVSPRVGTDSEETGDPVFSSRIVNLVWLWLWCIEFRFETLKPVLNDDEVSLLL
jgi:hypothetical protein